MYIIHPQANEDGKVYKFRSYKEMIVHKKRAEAMGFTATIVDKHYKPPRPKPVTNEPTPPVPITPFVFDHSDVGGIPFIEHEFVI
jgi:hypothetical protein